MTQVAGTGQTGVSQRVRFARTLQWTIIHLATLAVYAIPLFLVPNTSTINNREESVLDELHVMSSDNHDVNGASTLLTIFTNDYWGRPLTYTASHKSWRPLTVLSFRYLRSISGLPFSDLYMHRLVNVLTHSAASEMIGILAVRFWMPGVVAADRLPELDRLRTIAKICFALHPTHVEVVANAANRSHIMAVLLTVYASDPATYFLFFVVAVVLALLTSETSLFQVVSIAVTLSAISYRQRYHAPQSLPPRGGLVYQVLSTLWQPALLIRLAFLVGIAFLYYAGRLHYDTLSIPEGLIRPAENPFFPLTGWTRVYSYILVMAIHFGKLWDMDGLGFSHEYGHACVLPVQEDWRDPRLWPAAGIAMAHLLTALYFLYRQRRQRTVSAGLIFLAVYLAWTLTLFPVSGFVKVGTFISDRIVVPSTVPIAMLQAYAIASWIQLDTTDTRKYKSTGASNPHRNGWSYKYLLLIMVACLASKRIYTRSREWMSSFSLLESSLRTCPRFAKAHNEMSKIYSGLDPAKYNLTQARWHIEQAENIDPDFCDVHQQFALLAVKEDNFADLEKRLVLSLQCQFTMGGALPIWQQYWEINLNPLTHQPDAVAANKKRYESYIVELNAVMEREKAREAAKEQSKKQVKSPLAGLWSSG